MPFIVVSRSCSLEQLKPALDEYINLLLVDNKPTSAQIVIVPYSPQLSTFISFLTLILEQLLPLVKTLLSRHVVFAITAYSMHVSAKVAHRYA